MRPISTIARDWGLDFSGQQAEAATRAPSVGLLGLPFSDWEHLWSPSSPRSVSQILPSCQPILDAKAIQWNRCVPGCVPKSLLLTAKIQAVLSTLKKTNGGSNNASGCQRPGFCRVGNESVEPIRAEGLSQGLPHHLTGGVPAVRAGQVNI